MNRIIDYTALDNLGVTISWEWDAGSNPTPPSNTPHMRGVTANELSVSGVGAQTGSDGGEQTRQAMEISVTHYAASNFHAHTHTYTDRHTSLYTTTEYRRLVRLALRRMPPSTHGPR